MERAAASRACPEVRPEREAEARAAREAAAVTTPVPEVPYQEVARARAIRVVVPAAAFTATVVQAAQAAARVPVERAALGVSASAMTDTQERMEHEVPGELVARATGTVPTATAAVTALVLVVAAVVADIMEEAAVVAAACSAKKGVSTSAARVVEAEAGRLTSSRGQQNSGVGKAGKTRPVTVSSSSAGSGGQGMLTILCRPLTICTIAPLLAGCGGSQPPIGAPGAMQQTSPVGTHGRPGKSWMLHNATTSDLIYVTGECDGTCVVSYPGGEMVGSLNVGLGLNSGVCSDCLGNVYVADNSATSSMVVEYAHGGTIPIATFDLPGNSAAGCSVDPASGNLAVMFEGSGANVAIFTHASQEPQLYAARVDGSAAATTLQEICLSVASPVRERDWLNLKRAAQSLLLLPSKATSRSTALAKYSGIMVTLVTHRHLAVIPLFIA